MIIRGVRRVAAGRNAVDGAGVRLVRVFGNRDVRDFDPFLMLDAFDSTDPADYVKGFPWHPHRGIETVTYLVEGEIEHGDSLGNQGRIRSGDCQWMTAGSGIIHQEMPRPARRMFGAQLWINLPAAEKMCEPRYGDILQENVPVLRQDGRTVRIVAGAYDGTPGAFEGRYVKAVYLDVGLDSGVEWTYDCNPDATLFIYTLQGGGRVGPDAGEAVEPRHAVLTGPGDRFRITAEADGIRFLLLCGMPLGEPVAWGGPIVMNTREELDAAFRELDEGTFIRHSTPSGT